MDYVELHAFCYIRTSTSGPEAQLFLFTTLNYDLVKGVGPFLPVNNDHRRPIYDVQKTVLKNVIKFAK